MKGRFGVVHRASGAWITDPVSGKRVAGSRARMRQFAKDMMIFACLRADRLTRDAVHYIARSFG